MEGVETLYPLTSSKGKTVKAEKKTKERSGQTWGEKRSKAGWVAALIVLILLLLALGAGLWLVRRQTVFFGKAAGQPVESGEPVLANSYLFASPLRAAAGGEERIRLTVFVLDEQGRGVENRRVGVGEAAGLAVTAVQAQTDYLGRALFDIASRAAAEYQIEASVEGRVLPQRVKVTFK